MKTITRCVCAALVLCAGLGMAAAQETENTTPPPKVLVVDREFTKPGKGGSGHDKSESAFVQAFSRAKWPPICYYGFNRSSYLEKLDYRAFRLSGGKRSLRRSPRQLANR